MVKNIQGLFVEDVARGPVNHSGALSVLLWAGFRLGHFSVPTALVAKMPEPAPSAGGAASKGPFTLKTGGAASEAASNTWEGAETRNSRDESCDVPLSSIKSLILLVATAGGGLSGHRGGDAAGSHE